MNGVKDKAATPSVDGERLTVSERSAAALPHRRPSDMKRLVIPEQKVSDPSDSAKNIDWQSPRTLLREVVQM